MERDFTLFPQDQIGDGLWEMLQEGDDLTQPREIEFSVLFASEALALKFGQFLLENNQKLSFCPYNGDANFPWEITAYPEMVASYEQLSAYQNLITESATPYEGKYDGWYCVTAAKLPY